MYKFYGYYIFLSLIGNISFDAIFSFWSICSCPQIWLRKLIISIYFSLYIYLQSTWFILESQFNVKKNFFSIKKHLQKRINPVKIFIYPCVNPWKVRPGTVNTKTGHTNNSPSQLKTRAMSKIFKIVNARFISVYQTSRSDPNDFQGQRSWSSFRFWKYRLLKSQKLN